MLTTGRRAFQEFAEDFELWAKDKEGIKYLDLSKLDNPAMTSEDEFMPDVEYHGCIRDVDCIENGKDINVKIAAYVFDGGKTRVIAKFFNKINTTSKGEFDKFCRMYNIVDDDGKIQIEKIRGRFSKVVLFENSKGNKYIDSLEPLPVEYDVHNNQYKMLIKEYLNSHKTKKKD